MTPVLDRFLKYVSFDTESAPGADCFPSTAKQKVFAQYLVEELKGIGIAGRGDGRVRLCDRYAAVQCRF